MAVLAAIVKLLSYSQLVFYIANKEFLQVCNAFLFGFPSSWDIFFEESSGSNPSDWKMLEHQPETRFDPSFQQKTVCSHSCLLNSISMLNHAYSAMHI